MFPCRACVTARGCGSVPWMPATPPAEPGEAQDARTGTGENHKHGQMDCLTVDPDETQHAQAEGPQAEQRHHGWGGAPAPRRLSGLTAWPHQDCQVYGRVE